MYISSSYPALLYNNVIISLVIFKYNLNEIWYYFCLEGGKIEGKIVWIFKETHYVCLEDADFPFAFQLVIHSYSFENQLFYSIILKYYRLLSDRHSREEGLFIINALLL